MIEDDKNGLVTALASATCTLLLLLVEAKASALSGRERVNVWDAPEVDCKREGLVIAILVVEEEVEG